MITPAMIKIQTYDKSGKLILTRYFVAKNGGGEKGKEVKSLRVAKSK